MLPGSCDWWLHRKPVDPVPALLVSLTTGAAPAHQPLEYPAVARLSLSARASAKALIDLIANAAPLANDLLCLVADDIQIDRADWLWEALGLLERFPDAVMVGGRIRNRAELILSGGFVFGFAGVCGCPDRGRPALDPGYFTQMLKQRSVSAASSQFAVWRAGALPALAKTLPPSASVSMLGAWTAAWAQRHGKRVVYSPYLSGLSDFDWQALAAPAETAQFQKLNSAFIPDHRYYPAALDLRPERAYRLSP